MIEDAVRPPRQIPRRLRRGAYLLPSLFTIGNMLLGFYAIVLGLRQEFRIAALLVFVAAIVDSLDGRIARMTGTESEFGREYDSLADVVTFGAVPALLTYLWGLRPFDRDAWLIPLFYMVCAATRLARFNVQTKVVDSRYFVGLPVPAAAGTICSILFFVPDNHSGGDALRVWMQVLVATALLLIGVLMVSTFRYYSFKKFDLRKRWSFRALIPIAAIVLVVYYIPYAVLLLVTVVYTLSGPLSWLIGRLRGGNRPEESPPPPIPEMGP
ncbi:MAG TPA: CDP-diacylglycerol--serine O-phosphatidyltransferase [Thermoanaerobaculia bacterium]|nr:CDP-diacylglycerol--serine O-phosphatidyltransferase [Thermoanaerobaculia bacterium]